MTDNEMIFETAKIVEPNHEWEIFEDIYINAPQPYKQCVGYRYPAHSGWILARDYLNDLNAMHGAWSTLNRQQRISFSRDLREVVVNDGGHASSFQEDIVACVENATSRQRCEAFLRTHGK